MVDICYNSSLTLPSTFNLKLQLINYRSELDSIEDQDLRLRRLVELNVKEQVMNLCKTSIVQKVWAKGEFLRVIIIYYL